MPACAPFPAPTRPRLAPFAILALTTLLAASLGRAADDRLAPFFQAGKLRALVLSGRSNHDWRTTTPFLRDLLVGTGRFDVRVAEMVDGLAPEALAPFDVLVMDYGGPRWTGPTELAVESFVRSGKGLVLVHGAVYHFCGLAVLTDGHRAVGYQEPPWIAFRELAGCGWDAPPARGFHGARHTFPVSLRSPDHPITRGLPATLTATDELYQGLLVLPSATVLATALAAADRGGMDRDEPILIANRYGQGRVFTTVLGHELAGMWSEAFRIPFVRGTEWAATGAVTLPPNAGLPQPPPSPLRALVVTGGHDFEPSFYSVFPDSPDFAWTHAVSNREAFRRDLRAAFDVLVLYDMSPDLDEVGRGHLREFVEANKGIVVLHHAILDYPNWNWWWNEVVGGRYLEKAEPGHPASTYRHDEWIAIEPATRHPITADIGPLRLFDETYHGVWRRPDVTPLLKTDNPTSDPVVGWISPYPKSRVVYLQGGHGPDAHRHPAYRKLVQNAIRWSAGR